MRKLVGMSLAVVLTIFLAFGTALAEGLPSAKATAQCDDLSWVPLGVGYVDIFTQTIKMPEKKDLVIDVSLECGLTTNTKVMSKALERAVAKAEAMVKVRVWVDDKVAAPGKIVIDEGTGEYIDDGGIIFARRHQTLIAEFAGDISDAISVNPDTGVVIIDLALVEPETLQLILDTMAAHSFNFIAMDLESGEHTIVVQAKLTYNAQDPEFTDEDAAATTAYLGKGSVTIHNSRMIKDEDVEL